MKQSRFNVIDKGNQPTLVYNSYSGAIVALDAEYEKALFANGANGPSEIVDNLMVDFQSQRNSLNGTRVSAASATRK